MHVRARVGAEVGDDEDAVVAVVGIADRRQQDSAGAEAGQQQRVDAAPRSWSSRSVVEKAPTRVLRTTMSPGCGAIWSSMAVAGESAWKAAARCRHPGAHHAGRRDRGVVRVLECDADVADLAAAVTDEPMASRGAREQRVGIADAVEDARLVVHDEQGGALGQWREGCRARASPCVARWLDRARCGCTGRRAAARRRRRWPRARWRRRRPRPGRGGTGPISATGRTSCR